MNILSQLVHSVRDKGVVRTALIVFAHIQDLTFDFKYKTDTLRWQELNSISVVGENKVHGTYYQPTQVRTLLKVFKATNLPREGKFLDVGCGKGRVMILAAEFGYKWVLGVEFSELLCRIAEKNVSHYTRKFSPDTEFEIIHADAADYLIPPEVKTIFLFNPFDAVVLKRVLSNIEETLRTCPRKMYIIYRHPLHRDLIESSEMFLVLAQYSFAQCDFLVYTTSDS